MSMSSRRILPALLVILATAACGKPADPVRAALDRMVEAAHARDAAAVMAQVAADFQAADGSSRADDEALLRRYFAAYEVLDVRLEDVQIERSENTARVRLRAVMSGQPLKVGGLSGLLPSSATYDFDFRMSRDGGSWKVAWGSWNQAE
jgi:hypothetical protein